MDNLISKTLCDDGSCCCIPPRSTVALISIMSLIASVMERMSADSCDASCPMRDYVESLKTVLVTLFQLANLLLLLASVIENAALVNVYVCHTLGFVVMGLCVSILELLYRIQHEGAAGLACFVPEVAFIFVVSRCLPLVNSYRQDLEHLTAPIMHLENKET